MSETTMNTPTPETPKETKPSKTPKGSKGSKKSSGPVWDWTAGHGPITGAVSATTGAMAVATTGAAAGMPPAWALAIGTTGAVGDTIAQLRRRSAGRTIATRAASWLVGAGWTTWAMATGPLSWTAAGSLALIGVGIGTTARSMGLYEEAREEEAAAAQHRALARELSAERREIAAEWVERIHRVCGITLRVVGVEQWPAGTGYTLDAELPGGTTYERIAQEATRLSADAKLPHGCTATASPGVHQGRVLIDVGTVNVLADTVDYPQDYSPLSIYTGIPWGYRTNAEAICVYLREQCALVVGPTGSGKTNMLHVILAGFARCSDVVTWVIDLNAGSAGLSWVRPALTEQGTLREGVRPGIDWLAATVSEATTMLDTALRIGSQRKVVYQELMARHNTDQLPISAEIPQIMLVIDEGAEILTSNDRTLKQLAEKIREVVRLLRSMGIRIVLTALGATGSVLGNLIIRREAKARVALTGGETEGMDLTKMFPASRGLRTTQAPYKGSGFLGTPESPAGLFKNWRILPNQITDIVVATSDHHPTLDTPSANAAGDTYAHRWDAERTAWMREHLTTPPETDQDESPKPAPSPGQLNLSNLDTEQHDTNPNQDALLKKFRAEIDAEFATLGHDETPNNTDPTPGLNLSALREEQADSGPAWLAEAIEAIKATESTGMKPSAVADHVGRSRQTVRDALKAAASRGELVYRERGPRSVYVHPDHA